MTIKKVVSTRFIDDVEGLTYQWEPVNDEVTIIKSGKGKNAKYKAGYLVQDDDPINPAENEDDNLFLVHYHRDFDVRRDKIITEDDARNWYREEFDDYKNDPDDESEVGKFPLAETYWIFPVSALIHSGVWLSIGNSTHPCDSGGWDTSHVGLVLVSKSEWPDEDKALEAAKGHVTYWNKYLSGDVYGIVVETYDYEKNQIEEDSCWGYYGYEDTKQELKSQLEG